MDSGSETWLMDSGKRAWLPWTVVTRALVNGPLTRLSLPQTINQSSG